MGYWSGVWNSLSFNAGKAGLNAAENISYRYLRKNDGNLVYINNRGYKSVVIHTAKQTAMQLVEQGAHSLFPKYRKYLADKERDKVLKKQAESYKTLIEKGEKINEGLGVIETSGHKIIARDKYGNKHPQALMLYYDSDREIEYQDITYINGTVQKESYKANTVCFIDLVASVTMQSNKNLILTQVQGRDYSRKELVSGGDLTFSVSGKIVDNDMDIYPDNNVKKFIQLMQYGGVIKVNHFLFRQFNVEQIIIKDFSMRESDCRNTQLYEFTCVAVEPDEDVVITTDTISVINNEISKNSTTSKYKLILDNKLNSIIANNTSQFVAMGLDTLLPNI